MSTIFIGWGGNEPLATELVKKLEAEGHNTVRGGGMPTQMFVGDQIIKQMNSCDRAILLVEDKLVEGKNNGISTNLMYEWGYLVGYKRIKHIYAFMIDKKTNELPSDLHGVWADEVTRKIVSNETAEIKFKDDETLANEIYTKFVERLCEEKPSNYFEIIDKWPYISRDLENYSDFYNTAELAEYIVLGCLAAYYYNDNERFRNMLDRIVASGRISEIVSFAKIYVDVFLKSCDMSRALSSDAFTYAQSIKYSLENRKREMITNFTDKSNGSSETQSVLDDIIDVLCYDMLGLINLLYSKNDKLNSNNEKDAKIIKRCLDDACFNFEKTITQIDKLETRLGDNNNALIALLRSYIHNDLAHLYKDMGENEKFLDNLDKSVTNRHYLFENIHNTFPRNEELQDKMQQEYFIALSEQCIVKQDDYNAMTMKSVETKHNEWQDKVIHRQKTAYTNILLERLSKNIEKFNRG